MDHENIDLKYKIPKVGSHHKGIDYCPKCDFQMIVGMDESLFNNIIGFCDTNVGMTAVIECPECFTKWRFHAYDYVYSAFLDAIKWGTQKHFKPTLKKLIK